MRDLRWYVSRGHKQVEGWLLDGAIKMIVSLGKAQELRDIRGNIAEIGVHHGKLFILLHLLARDDERSVAIDLFEDQSKNIDGSGEGNRQKLLANLQRFADLDRVVIRQADSIEIDAGALLRLAGGPCRIISIDGGHTPEITAHDLATAEGALSDGGIVILDDVFNEMWPGVSEGLHVFFRMPRRIAPFATGGNKTFLSQAQYVQYYKKALRGLSSRSSDRQFLSANVVCCDFTPLLLIEKIARTQAWKSIKDVPAVKLARRVIRGR